MMFLKLVLNGGLIFMATIAEPFKKNGDNVSLLTLDYKDHHLPSAIVPIHYNIMLEPFMDLHGYIYERGNNHKVIDILEKYELRKIRGEADHEIYFYGQSNVTVNILRTTRQLILHSLNLHIQEEATMLITEHGTVYKPIQHLYNNDIITLDFKEQLPPGHYSLSMKFVGISINNNNKGFLIMPYTDLARKKELLLISHLQPIEARRIFPCWDEPAFKATFNISLKHNTPYTALSNMPKTISINITDYKNKLTWTQFQKTERIPTYLVAFVLLHMSSDVNSFIFNITKQIKHTWWSRTFHQLSYAKLVAQAHIAFLYKHWENYINFSILNYIVIPEAPIGSEFRNDIIDNWGMIFYRESDIIGQESDSFMTKIRIERFVGYKMARQLFSNLVTPTWWSYLWLNDALAQFFGVHACSQIFPKHRTMDLFVVQDLRESLRIDYKGIMMSLAVEVRNPSEIENLFSSTRYAFTLRYKAPALIFMLQHMVGHETLQEGIRRYFDKYAFITATPDDLWNNIQMAVHTSNTKFKVLKLKTIMDSWIDKISYPILNVNLNHHGHVVLNVTYPSNVGIQNMWQIPLTFTTQKNMNFNITTPISLMDHLYLVSFHDVSDWIIINIQQTGYYRVNYYSDNWWKIANFLKSEEYEKIHILNRAQIIDDAYHFLTLGKLELPIFLELTKYLSHETDYVAWYPMFRIFESISNIIPFSKKWNMVIKVHMRNILHGLFEKIKYNEQSGEDDLTKSLRKEATKWACIFGDSECLKYSTTILKLHLVKFSQITRFPQCEAWRNLKNLLKANIDVDRVMDNIKFLLPGNIHLVNEIRRYLWTSEREIRQEIMNILYIITTHGKHKRVLEYLLNNFKHFEILPNQHDLKGHIALLIIIINHAYDRVQLEMILNIAKLLHNEKIMWMFHNKLMLRLTNYRFLFDNYKYLRIYKSIAAN